jgi:Ca-activated chloride channel family protein
MGNHNDAMLEELSNKANGNYAFVDNEREARKVLSEQLDSTLVTIAKDVKIQIEFNPARVAAYRLIGYENRMLRAEEFNDDRKDAGEVGARHRVTALYEVVPVEADSDAVPSVDSLRYQAARPVAEKADKSELMTVKVRYKQPDRDESQLLTLHVEDGNRAFAQASGDFQFASAVAAFGMLPRNSPFRGDADYDTVKEIARAASTVDRHGYRSEFLEMVDAARKLTTGEEPKVSFLATQQPEIIGGLEVHSKVATNLPLVGIILLAVVWLVAVAAGLGLVVATVVSREAGAKMQKSNGR